MTIRIDPDRTTVSVVAHLPLLNGADPAIELSRRVKIKLDGRDFAPGTPQVQRDTAFDNVTWEAVENRTASSISVDAPVFPEVQGDTTIATVYRGDTVYDQVALTPSHPSAVAGQNVGATLRRFTTMGVNHILSGPDHILFVIGLILVAVPLRRLLAVVTAFTIAHSITLTLTALGVASLTPRIVEPVIALSIVAIGIENILRPHASLELRIWLAFGFGFFHGFGFAGALAEAGLPKQTLAWSLAAFNIGVEIGQAGIVLLVAPLLAQVAKRNPPLRGHITRYASVLISLAGAVWFVTRL